MKNKKRLLALAITHEKQETSSGTRNDSQHGSNNDGWMWF